MSDAPAQKPQPTITSEKRDNACIIAVNVKLLDDKHLKMLGQMIEQTKDDKDVSLIVVDCSRVELLPSLGLGMLVQFTTKCKSQNRALKLAAVRPQVRQVLSITKLNRVLDLADSVEAALQG